MQFKSPEQEEVIVKHNQAITDKLRLLEKELHELNVQLIRESVSADPSSKPEA